jgi:hypothetical protein
MLVGYSCVEEARRLLGSSHDACSPGVQCNNTQVCAAVLGPCGLHTIGMAAVGSADEGKVAGQAQRSTVDGAAKQAPPPLSPSRACAHTHTHTHTHTQYLHISFC